MAGVVSVSIFCAEDVGARAYKPHMGSWLIVLEQRDLRLDLT